MTGYEDDQQDFSGWVVETLDDAYQETTPTEYVVRDYFETASLNIVFGAPGSMKSMLMADLAYHVAAGMSWLPGAMPNGRGVEICKPGPVLWLDFDNGKRRTRRRLAAVGRAANQAPADLRFISMPTPTLIADDPATMIMLRDLILETGAVLVVIDNLGLVTGQTDENSASMATIMGGFRKLAEKGPAIVIIHHQRKGGANGGRSGEALRGHSSIEAALDLALLVGREDGADELTLTPTKARGVLPPVAMARFNYEHQPGTSDLWKAWFDGKAARRGDNALRDTILAIASDHDGIGKVRLTEAVRDALGQEAPGVNKVRGWIDDLIALGMLEERPVGKHKLIYRP